MKKDKKEIFILISFFLAFNLYKIIFSLFFSKPTFDTPQDLFSTLYAPAYFAGLDWHRIGSVYSEYYGYGFFGLFSFLFRLTTDGMIIYRILVLVCNLLSVFSCVICYKIIKGFDIWKGSPKSYFISVVCVAFQHVGEIGVANEYPLNLCVWIIIYILVLLCKDNISKKRRIILTMLLLTLLVYSCTVHARAIVLYVLTACCVVYVGITKKRCVINFPVMLVGLLLLIPYKVYTDYLQSILLGKISLNSTITTRLARAADRSFFSGKMLHSVLNSIIFYCHETVILSAGIAALCVAVIIYILFCHDGKKAWKNLNQYTKDRIVCGLMFSVTGIGVFIAGLCYTWMTAFYEGIYLLERENLRGLTLTRYYTPFVGPAVCFTIILLVTLKSEIDKCITRILIGVIIFLQVLFFLFSYPLVKYTGWAGEQYISYTLNRYQEPYEIYLAGMLIVFALCSVIFYCLRKNNWILLMSIVFIYIVFGQVYVFWDRNGKDIMFEQVDAGYRYFKEDCGKEIYVYEENLSEEETDDKANYYFLYQILLPQNVIIPLESIEDIDSGIILTGNEDVVMEYGMKYNVLQLDDNEWMMMK